MSMSGRQDLADVPTEALLDQALALACKDPQREETSDELWPLITTLQRRPEESTFEAASEWCRRGGPQERELGVNILAQLGHIGATRESPFSDRSLPILLSLLEDPEPRVLESAIIALGHFANYEVAWDPERLRDLAHDGDVETRYAVAFALGGTQCDASPVAVEIVLGLMTDSSRKVRDWATFGLAISDVDSETVREAFLKRLEDEDETVREEAMTGLAKRRDERALPIVISELSNSGGTWLAIEAATALGRPELIPQLEELLEEDPDSDEIKEALRACRGQLP